MRTRQNGLTGRILDSAAASSCIKPANREKLPAAESKLSPRMQLLLAWFPVRPNKRQIFLDTPLRAHG